MSRGKTSEDSPTRFLKLTLLSLESKKSISMELRLPKITP